MVQIWPWYNLRGLNICITWVALYVIRISDVNAGTFKWKRYRLTGRCWRVATNDALNREVHYDVKLVWTVIALRRRHERYT